jgi:hypothetical protein
VLGSLVGVVLTDPADRPAPGAARGHDRRPHLRRRIRPGAGLMLLLHISDADQAFFDSHTGIEWNVIFLLLGMMMIVSVLRRTGSSSTSPPGRPNEREASPTG